MGWTLSRYFFFRYLSITIGLFVAISTLVLIINFTELSSRSGDVPGFTTSAVLVVSALRVPMVMQQVVPFIALIAAMTMLIALNRKYELVVVRSAGVSAWQFLRPAAFGALLFGLFTIMVMNPIAAMGFTAAETLEAEYRSGKSNEIAAEGAPWIKQTTEEGEAIIGAHAVLAQGTELVDASVFRFDAKGNLVERIDAKRAFLRNGFWELRKIERRSEGKPVETLTTLEIPTNLRPEFVEDKLARPEAISLFELPRKIDVARSFGLKANAYAMQFHSLVALPPLLVAMTLIAATVSMRFARMGQSMTMILGGVVAGFLLYVVSVLVKAFGTAGFVPPPVAAWLPVVVATFFGVTYLLYKEDG